MAVDLAKPKKSDIVPAEYDNYQKNWDDADMAVWDKRHLIDSKVVSWEQEKKKANRKFVRQTWFQGEPGQRGFFRETEDDDEDCSDDEDSDDEEGGEDDDEEEEEDEEVGQGCCLIYFSFAVRDAGSYFW